MESLELVKLGGSLITDKRRRGVARRQVIRRLAAEIASAWPCCRGRLVLGHGSGSFGHVAAAEAGLGAGAPFREGPAGVSATQHQAARLHRIVIEALLEAGLPPFSLAPSSALLTRAGRPVAGQWEPLWRALESGLLPVVYGDVVLDRSGGASVCSTEMVLLALARTAVRRSGSVRRALWCGETEGVLDRRGRLIRLIDRSSDLSEVLGAADGTDVTGGMRHRVEACRRLAELGVESWILSGAAPGRLALALRGKLVPASRLPAAEETPSRKRRKG